MSKQVYDFAIKKMPKQGRSQATFNAVVEACARLLAQSGYQNLTTNHVAQAAGVGIASLYEYFPNKDAIVAQVAERLVQRVMAELSQAVPEVMEQPPQQAMIFWIKTIYAVLSNEVELVRVFHYEVPYTNRLPAVQTILPKLMSFSKHMQQQSGDQAIEQLDTVTGYLIVNLVSSTVIQMLLNPPMGVSQDELLAGLAHRVEQWLL